MGKHVEAQVGLRVKIARYSIYLLYWYKSKRTDAGYSVYLIYWYKNTKTDARYSVCLLYCTKVPKLTHKTLLGWRGAGVR